MECAPLLVLLIKPAACLESTNKSCVCICVWGYCSNKKKHPLVESAHGTYGMCSNRVDFPNVFCSKKKSTFGRRRGGSTDNKTHDSPRKPDTKQRVFIIEIAYAKLLYIYIYNYILYILAAARYFRSETRQLMMVIRIDPQTTTHNI